MLYRIEQGRVVVDHGAGERHVGLGQFFRSWGRRGPVVTQLPSKPPEEPVHCGLLCRDLGYQVDSAEWKACYTGCTRRRSLPASVGAVEAREAPLGLTVFRPRSWSAVRLPQVRRPGRVVVTPVPSCEVICGQTYDHGTPAYYACMNGCRATS